MTSQIGRSVNQRLHSPDIDHLMLFKLLIAPFILSTLFVSSTLGRPAWSKNLEFSEPTVGQKLFALEVRAILTEKCEACHSPGTGKKLKGELNLTTRAGALAGGEFSDRVLVPGNAKESLLFAAATRKDPDLQMPPKDAEKLDKKQLWAVRSWIEAGAPWPDDATVAAIREKYASGIRVVTSGGLSDDWSARRYDEKSLWAYRPVIRQDLRKSAENPVDYFVDSRLAAEDLEPAGEAAPRVLVRRLAFDLTGLPPSPALIDRFLAANQIDRHTAWKRLIEELLNSPHYGEQYGRHWLDVVRYADSAGFANDFERPNAWRYRDYVVRSFQNDKPYDQFVREQIAGDEIDSSNSEMLIATGFLRMGPWEQTGMSVDRVTRQQFLDDVTDSVGQTFLAHPLQCARCHDHKFDPLPTRDYYAIQAVFSTTQFADRDAPWLPHENTRGFEEEQRVLEARLKSYGIELKRITEKTEASARKWYKERDLQYVSRSRALQQKLPEDKIVPARHGLETFDLGMDRIARKNSARHRWELDRYRPIAFSVFSGKTPHFKSVNKRLKMPADPMARGTLENTAILTGGDPFSPGQRVKPGILTAVPNGMKIKLPQTPRGRRTAFASWLVDGKNPLTARVMVNRIWAWHFGKGIAGNPNNFGSTGKRPTHPELLDWLASEFVRSGWSVKHIHRILLTSKAYRRSSDHPRPERLAENDPYSLLYSTFVPRRLAAEEIRDAMLSASGELNPEIGGIPCRPDMNLEAAFQPRMIMGTYAPAYQPNRRPRQRNRRSLYALKIRGLRDPFLEVFNQPASGKSCELRDTSTVTPQAFTLFNSEESADRSLALAARLRKDCGDDRKKIIESAFTACYGRLPEAEEIVACLKHWRDTESLQASHEPEPREYPTEINLEVKEEISGESFTYRQKLEFYEGYVHDLRPHEVDAATRALATICLVLFNSNEFAYVY